MKNGNGDLLPQNVVSALFTMAFPQAIIFYLLGLGTILIPSVFQATTGASLPELLTIFLHCIGTLHIAFSALSAAKASLIAAYFASSKKIDMALAVQEEMIRAQQPQQGASDQDVHGNDQRAE